MIPVFVGLGVLAGVAYRVIKPKGITPEREKIYTEAMNKLRDPGKLRALASAFEGEGLDEHADLLRKRAGLRELPEDVKQKRRVIFRQAMRSENADAIEALAGEFQKLNCFGAANALRLRVDALRAAM